MGVFLSQRDPLHDSWSRESERRQQLWCKFVQDVSVLRNFVVNQVCVWCEYYLLTDSTSAPRSIQTTGKLGMSWTFSRKGIVSSNLLKLLSCHFNVSALINGTFNWKWRLYKSLSVSHLNPAVKLQSHSCAWFHVEVQSMLLWIRVEASEVLQLALCEVEVGVGESCGCTLALRGKTNQSWLCQQPTW